MLDIGCGGGLLSEPMARHGRRRRRRRSVREEYRHRLHPCEGRSGVSVDYRAVTAEELAEAGETFDIVLNMEVVEHVADVELFMTTCAENGPAPAA